MARSRFPATWQWGPGVRSMARASSPSPKALAVAPLFARFVGRVLHVAATQQTAAPGQRGRCETVEQMGHANCVVTSGQGRVRGEAVVQVLVSCDDRICFDEELVQR